MANTVDHTNKGPQRAAWFFGLDPDGEEFRPVDRVFGPDDPNSDLCSEPLKGLDCAMHDSDWRLKYPIPLPEEPKPRCKVILEDVAPPECPLIKAIREQDEKDKNTETKPNGANTMISNPQKKTPIRAYSSNRTRGGRNRNS
ncbi:GL14406 [Drosophila persimilis]|uniref:GL14406 n=1 Tax=Drosophila persimilis TaxID=7234 RepID=B4GTS1_DROPE|nr:GL14406 [Drosophila persimilis]